MISIIMPVHDRKTFLCQAIESALNQTSNNYELIIIKSKDSPKQITDILELYPNVKVLISETKSISEKINLGIEHAKYEWIKCLSSDDELMPNCIKDLILNIYDKSKYYYTYFYYINEVGIITEALKLDSIVSACFHKELLKKIGLFSDVKNEDKDFIERIPNEDKIQIPIFTARYRVHNQQLSQILRL